MQDDNQNPQTPNQPNAQQPNTTTDVKPTQTAPIIHDFSAPTASEAGQSSTASSSPETAPQTQPAIVVGGTPNDPSSSTVPQPATTPPAVKKSKRNLFLSIGVGVVVLVALIVGAVLLLTRSSISAEDKATAKTTTAALQKDVDTMVTGYKNLSNDTTPDAGDIDMKIISKAIDDAKTQYAKLQSSPVLKDSKVNDQFKTVTAKWQPFIDYNAQNLKDNQVLNPIISKFSDDINSLSSQPPTTVASLATYLATFKSLVDSTSTQLKSIKVGDANNQKELVLVQTFLQTCSKTIATAQLDLSKNNLAAVNTDLQSLDTAVSKVSTSGEAVTKDATDQLVKLSPSSALSAFSTAVANL